MYDELVNSLRICGKIRSADDYCVAFHDGCCEAEPVCMYELMMKAANAIEELSADCYMYRKGMTDEHNRAAKLAWAKEHCWIPVTERLPKENEPCIVYNKYYGPLVGWRVDGERFRIPGSRFPDHPTHWMPLPQPPKEE